MKPENRIPLFLAPGEGRSYAMGSITALFKADGEESAGKYSISEWWLEPFTKGPGAHSHTEDDVFFVIEGTMSFLIGEQWKEAPKGSFILVPGGVTHDFENRGAVRAGILNFSAPGNFERHMPDIVNWFEEHPPGKTD
ncbi:MAG TPA: cupin domain-containing protein [Cellvibrionaceae bacterium]